MAKVDHTNIGLAVARCGCQIDMEGIGPVDATVVGWNRKRHTWRIEFPNGNRASIRPDRVHIEQTVAV